MTDGVSFLIHGLAKRGKALDVDTPLPTPTGWTTMGKVQPGDELLNGSGQPTTVVAVGPEMENRPCRRVSFRKQEPIIADVGHVWWVKRGGGRDDWKLAETGELMANHAAAIPASPVLRLPEVDLPVDPYVLGMWLGDGTTSGSDITAGNDKLDALYECVRCYDTGEVRIQILDDGRIVNSAFLPMLHPSLRDAGAVVDGVKAVPPLYLRAGIEQRRALLAGLLDSDGSVEQNGIRTGASFTNTNWVIADAVVELARSLGFLAYHQRTRACYTRYNGNVVRGKDAFCVVVQGVTARSGLTRRPERRANMARQQTIKRNDRLYVTGNEEVVSVTVRCIQVDDVHGTFLAGRSMLPTHNSTLNDTSPAPRLVLDAEGGSRFTPSRKVRWEPARESPPEHDGSWDTCLVSVREYRDLQRAYEYLNTGRHPFESVGIDSISETQQRCVDSIAGTNPMQPQDWGELLRTVSHDVRKFRDFVTHPVKPLRSVVFIAMTRQVEDQWRPYVQGQLATVLPYYVDVCGYLFTQSVDGSSELQRRLLTVPWGPYEAGERVGGRLPAAVDEPTVAGMVEQIVGKED